MFHVKQPPRARARLGSGDQLVLAGDLRRRALLRKVHAHARMLRTLPRKKCQCISHKIYLICEKFSAEFLDNPAHSYYNYISFICQSNYLKC